MNSILYPKGSEWRKWDLHVHTPESFHWKGGMRFSEMSDSEAEAEVKKIVDKINGSDIAVFAIVDYWTVDGYLRIKNYMRNNPNALNSGKLLLPGIELRVSAPVNYRLNMQVIFDDNLSDQNLKDFVGALKIHSTNSKLSQQSLIEYARSLSTDKAEHHGHPNYQSDDSQAVQLGSKTAEIVRASLDEAIETLPARDRCMIVMPWDTSDGLSKLDWKQHSGAATDFMMLPDVFESRSNDMKLTFNGVKTEQNSSFFDSFIHCIGKKGKPVICGSDAHKIEDYGMFPGDKATWIKADPTFNGLTQIRHEPLDRIHIGLIPEAVLRVSQDKTRYLSSLNVAKKDGATTRLGNWFDDTSIPLNSELVAIIGNKGSGKSAIADIIGFLGNSKKSENTKQNFSFLNTKRFCQKGLADCFVGTLEWEDNSKSAAGLMDSPNLNEPERIQYIPQNFFETLTNELELKDFESELKRVVFNHLSEITRSGKTSFEELETAKAQNAEADIHRIRASIEQLSKELSNLERLKGPDVYKATENEINAKKLELAAHDSNKPSPPESTEASNELQGESNLKKLEDVNQQLSDLETKINVNELQLGICIDGQEKLIRSLKELENIDRQVQNFKLEFLDIFAREKLDTSKVQFSFDRDSIELAIEKQGRVIEELRSTLKTIAEIDADTVFEQNSSQLKDQLNSKSLFAQFHKLVSHRSTLKEKVSQPARDQQNYLEALKNWEGVRNTITGDANNPNSNLTSLAYHENKKNFIDNFLNNNIESTRSKLLDQTLEIYSKKNEILKIYKDLKTTAEGKLKHSSSESENLLITFETRFKVEDSFESKLIKYVDTRKKGTFLNGDVDRRLSRALDSTNFQSPESVTSSLLDILGLLDNDERVDAQNEQRYQTNQIADLDSFYCELFSLNYLNPVYILQLDGKQLEELSPGEKGALLLVFYLSIEQGSIPLVIDQPEDNLDNKTVYQLLTHYIRQAKKTRQIIIVTHNPNLAIGADAEQIIHVELNKSENHTFVYLTGSIEDPRVNAKVLEVLEGTKPAFVMRRLKYM